MLVIHGFLSLCRRGTRVYKGLQVRVRTDALAKRLLTFITIIMNEGSTMDLFWTVAAILVVLWLLGLIGNIGGGLIHALLVIAAIVVLIRLIQGRDIATGK